MASSSSLSLAGKVAIVTGASSGIGAAIGHALVEAGASVVLCARRVDRLEQEKTQIDAKIAAQKLPGRVVIQRLDVVVAADWAAVVEATKKEFGHIDVLVNNAGVMLLSKVEKLKVDEWLSMVDINVKSVLLGTAAVLPVFTEQKNGHIVNISSDADRKVFPGSAVYSATKAAVTKFTEGVRMELAAAGLPIRVTSLSPGAVMTELGSHITDMDIIEGFKNGPKFDFLQAKDIADLVTFVLSRPAHVDIDNIFVRPQGQFF